MAINHLEPAYTADAAPFIERFGGKMGGLIFLRQFCDELRGQILRPHIVEADESPSLPRAISKSFSRYIFRASHPHDFQGLVDVIPSEVRSGNAGGEIIDDIRGVAQSADVMRYAQYENPAYNGKVTVGVQEYQRPYSVGDTSSIVEHPNQPGRYLISHAEGGYVYSGLYKEDGEAVDSFMDNKSIRFAPHRGIELYEKVKRSGLVKEGMSFQVEFAPRGGEDHTPLLYQVRAFMPMQEATFRLPITEKLGGVPAEDALVFGVTPPEGIVLPLIQSPTYGAVEEPSGPWALLRTWQHRRASFDFMPQRMKVYIPTGRVIGHPAHRTLQHTHFQLAQKADVTVFPTLDDDLDLDRALHGHYGGSGEAAREFSRKTVTAPRAVRIISDGINAVIEVAE